MLSYTPVNVYVCAYHRERGTCATTFGRPVPSVGAAVLSWLQRNLLIDEFLTATLRDAAAFASTAPHGVRFAAGKRRLTPAKVRAIHVSMALRRFVFTFAAMAAVVPACGGPRPAVDEPRVGMQEAAMAAAGPSVAVDQAIRGGCYSDAQLRAIFDATSFRDGSVTKRKIDQYFYNGAFPDQNTTKLRVNALTWVYRGYGDESTSNWHVRKLLAGILYSKAQNRVDQGRMNWDANGPELKPSDFSARSPTVIAMRLLAIQTSDEPPSQFVSVALTEEVASRFGNVVYAFQVRPDSEVLGVRGCKLGAGEDQFQIAGGTSVSNLHRRVARGQWTKYYPTTGSWVPVTGSFPPN